MFQNEISYTLQDFKWQVFLDDKKCWRKNEFFDVERGRRVLKEAKPGARKVETTMSYLCDEDANIFVTRMPISL